MGDFCEAERKRAYKWANFQLPHQWKRVAVWAFWLILGLMLFKKFVGGPEWVRPILKNAMVLALLAISISKEKIEDEFIVSLRSLSFRWAFIMGAVYSVVQPFINYGADVALGKEHPELDTGAFPVLIFMLLVQLLFFHQIKRMS